MQKTEIVHTRISPETKNECDYIFSKLGITTSYAITMFLNQVALRKGIPFEIKLEVPNDETKKAIEVGREIAKDKNIKGYKSIDELKEALEK